MKKVTMLLVLASASFLGLPANAETLRAAATGNVSTLLNPFSSMVQGIINPHAMIHDMLFYVSTDGTLEPGLALSAEPTSSTTWNIKLRPDVKYSNGRAFTAEAVVKTITYLQSAEAGRYVLSAETSTIKSARAIDDLTLEVETHQPDVLLPRRFGTIPMPEPWLYEELGPDAFSQAPIGTGSYVVEDWRLEAQRPLLKANWESWRPPMEIDAVDIRLVKDAPTQVQALLSEQVDIGYNFGVVEIDLLRSQGFKIIARPGGQTASLALSNTDPESPFTDQRVRQALNYAVDKQAIADIIMMGTTEPAGQPGYQGMTGYNPDVAPYPYDPARAKALLNAAGYSDGLSFRADVLVAGGLLEAATTYQKVAQDLAAVGVDVEFNAVQGQEWIRKYFSGDWSGADSISATWNGASYWDVVRAIEIFSCNKPGAFFCDESVMPVIAASHGMFDKQERDETLQDLSKTMHDLAPALFLVYIVDVIAVSDRLGELPFRHKQLAVDQLRLQN
ncbi:MAG: ABC transporter substrate-binding protein [Rhodospirillaceae bacterium]